MHWRSRGISSWARHTHTGQRLYSQQMAGVLRWCGARRSLSHGRPTNRGHDQATTMVFPRLARASRGFPATPYNLPYTRRRRRQAAIGRPSLDTHNAGNFGKTEVAPNHEHKERHLLKDK
ncbi:hypothetical protein VTK26DRAFT_2259 [Humicola hyalothermophila]